MSCGTCGIQASNTMQGDTGVPAGAPQSQRPRCPRCRAFIAQAGAECHNPRCPSHASDVFEGDDILTRGTVRVTWQDIGEGLSGDYDPDDPEDIPLLRFYVQRLDLTRGEWEDVEAASYCTLMPVSTPPEKRRRALQILMDRFYAPVMAGQSVRKIGQKMSWISPEDVGGQAAPTPNNIPSDAAQDSGAAPVYISTTNEIDAASHAPPPPPSSLVRQYNLPADVDLGNVSLTDQVNQYKPTLGTPVLLHEAETGWSRMLVQAGQHTAAATIETDTVALDVQGYRRKDSAPGYGGGIVVIYGLDEDHDHDRAPYLEVWANRRSRKPTHRISLAKASEGRRTPEAGGQDGTASAPLWQAHPESGKPFPVTNSQGQPAIQGSLGNYYTTAVTAELSGVSVDIKGYGICTAPPGHGGGIVYLALSQQHPVLYVWADIAKRDPTHVIDLSGAAE